MRIIEVLKLLEANKPKSRYLIAFYLREGLIPGELVGNRWDVSDKYVSDAIRWIDRMFCIDELFDKESYLMDDATMDQCRRTVESITKRYLEKNEYTLLFQQHYISLAHYKEVRDIVDRVVNEFQTKQRMLPIKDAAEILLMSNYRLKSAIRKGCIAARRIKNNWYLEENVVMEYKDKIKNYIGSYDLASEIIKNMDTLFDLENRTDRAQMNAALRKSSFSNELITWDEAGMPGDRKNAYYIPLFRKEDAERVLKEYFEDFGMAIEKVNILLDNPYFNKHAKTKELLTRFGINKSPHGMAALMDTLVSNLDKDIVECTNDDIKKLIKYAEMAKTKVYVLYLLQFIAYVSRSESCNYDIEVRRASSDIHNSISTQAYTLSQFLFASYMAFNDEYINDHNMIEKAITEPKYAFMWLFVCWHFIGAWRASDFWRMPVLPLFSGRDEVIEMIMKGNYEIEADKIALLLESEINEQKMLISKTHKRQNKEYLTVHISELMRGILGTVYSICVIHSQGRNEFKQYRFIDKDYTDFFGEEYERFFGNNTFSNRRANKAFMDMIVEITEESNASDNKLLGYAVAQFARGHSAKDGGISTITSKYLQTKLDGMTPNEILMNLWDSGVCSFVPYMLLNVVYGEDFNCLGVDEQTQIIKMSGLTAYSSEMVSKSIQQAYLRAKNAVDSLFQNYESNEEKKKLSIMILKNMLTGQAVGKEVSVPCVMAAMRKPCPYGDKRCWSCPQAMYKRVSLVYLADTIKNEYAQLHLAKTDWERKKRQLMLDKVYLPTAYDLLMFSKEVYHMDVRDYQNTILEAMSNGEEINVKEN